MTVEVPLTRGKVALIDDVDADRVLCRTWHAGKSKKRWYAKTCDLTPDGKRVFTYLHRFLMDAVSGVKIDHRNGDGLDNRRENLRVATDSQNCGNSKRRDTNQCGFKGVCFHKQRGRWKAEIQHEKKRYSLGLHDTAEAASLAYDCAARELFGDFALLNHPEVDAYPFKADDLLACKKTSAYPGVYREVTKSGLVRWVAHVKEGGRQVKIGRFLDQESAADALRDRGVLPAMN